jgi:hypothetical protein
VLVLQRYSWKDTDTSGLRSVSNTLARLELRLVMGKALQVNDGSESYGKPEGLMLCLFVVLWYSPAMAAHYHGCHLMLCQLLLVTGIVVSHPISTLVV